MNFDNMTLEELAQFNREYDELQAAYASAAEHDAKMQAMNPIPDEWEDEMEYWSRAGLDSRGRP
jgi:translation initiation factor 2 alpha subunit (eIF-2alpha)